MFSERPFNYQQLENIHVELPPSSEDFLVCNYNESPMDKIYQEDKIF